MLSAPEQDTTIPPGTESPHTEHVVENEYQDDDYVSLDEEDEELIWRVFSKTRKAQQEEQQQ